jgi:hypothetical protein
MSLEEAVPEGPDATRLRRLIAEVEMWLHGHAVNAAREHHREPHISSLWPWGGGPLCELGLGARAVHSGESSEPGIAPPESSTRVSSGSTEVAVFGPDAYLNGLAVVIGASVHELPQELAPVFGYSSAARVCVRIEIGSMLQQSPAWTVLDAFAQIDQRFIAPAMQALHAGSLSRLDLLANDLHLSTRAVDRLKRWRRTRPGVSGLLS